MTILYNEWLFERELKLIRNYGAKTSKDMKVMRAKKWRLLKKLEMDEYSKERVLAHYLLDDMMQQYWITFDDDILNRTAE